MITRRRSVGSILKPILYKLAFQWGADGESYILDDTRVYETEDTTKQYLPENYIPKSYGPIRLKEALGNSLNSTAVRLSESLGIGHIYDTFRSYGLDLDHEVSHYGYGIALGTPELTLENVIEWYTFLTDLSEKENSILYRVLSDGRNRARTFWVSSILNTSVPLAVKTGTSTDFRDNWAIGYNSDIIIGIWVGNTDGRSMDDVSWVSGAGPLYHQIAEYMIEKGYISSDIPPVPPWLHEDYICLDIGCFQKEKWLLQDGHVVRSHPRDKKYFASDFVTSMTSDEMKKWKIE